MVAIANEASHNIPAGKEGSELTDKQFSERSMNCAQRLHRISYLILGREADCEDAVQEALLKAWSHLSTLKNESYFETWLIRILINESRRILRKRRAHPTEELPLSLAAPEPPDRALHDALMALESKFRIPVILHHLEGYGIREIAVMLSIPESAVKFRLRRGRELLKLELKEEK